MNQADIIFGSTVLLVALVGYRAAKILGKLPAAVVTWVVFSGVFSFLNPHSLYSAESSAWGLVLDSAAAAGTAQFLITVLAAYALPLWAYAGFFQIVALLNALWLIIGHFYGCPWGFGLNASMSGSFQAALLPLFFVATPFAVPSVVLSLAAIVFAFKSTPYLVLFALAVVLSLRAKQYQWTAFLGLVALILFPRGDTHGRMGFWTASMNWWSAHASWLLGTGTGTYSAIGPALTKPNTAIWLHWDWLQILFEQGAAGLTLCTALYVTALWYARARPWLFYSLMGYGAFAFGQYPLHQPVTALYGAFLIRAAIETAQAKKSTPHPNYLE